MGMVIRRKIDFAVVAKEKLAIFVARRKKGNFTAIAEEKFCNFYSKKEQN